MNILRTPVLSFTLFFALLASAGRERLCFDRDWRFILADTATFSFPTYDDSHWRRLDVPHDWAIEGDFHADHKSGASGGALPGGVGWYRKRFVAPLSPPEGGTTPPTLKAKSIVAPSGAEGGALRASGGGALRASEGGAFLLSFDGVYMNSTVYVNGHEVGCRPYGYSSFEYDITPYVHEGSNVLAVRVDNSDQPNSRWYSGCGIYRHVWLTRVAPVHVAHWGVNVQTNVGGNASRRYKAAMQRSEALAATGVATIEVTLEGDDAAKATVENSLIAPDGRVVGFSKGLTSTIKVSRPLLWSPQTPNIYKVHTTVKVGGRVVDDVVTWTGFRSFRFDAETGFWLNGENMKINGVCMHHDLGCLGAALHEDALHRQLLKLRQMGCNAIRCSHNPPAPELLDMCDTMGFIVMDESFDMWRRRKTQNDYARFFDEWAERDLTDLVLRDRNHPCVLIWSIGNEVLEQWSDAKADTLTLEQANLILNAGHDASTLAKEGEMSINSILTRRLASIVRRYDTSRPITAGCNEPSPGNHLFRSGALDIIGYNYHNQNIPDVPKNFPGKPFIITESVSAIQSRGTYRMPSDILRQAPRHWWEPHTDPSFECSAYDNSCVPWGSTHEQTWDIVKHTPYVSGQFIWTGWDYIGEPTPYGFPAHSSYFGIIDLAGFPKDAYYMYQSEWTGNPQPSAPNPQSPMVLHLFPHWNWLPGDTIDVWCYYNQADEVELFLNGRSMGKAQKSHQPQLAHHPQLTTAYHVGWRVPYVPGEVRVVARKDGKVVAEQSRRSAGQPSDIALSIDYQGRDLCFVNVGISDDRGTLCPHASDEVFFRGSDGLEIVAVDNGCPFSTERFKADHRRAWHGRCMVVVRGQGTLTARAYGLKENSIRISRP